MPTCHTAGVVLTRPWCIEHQRWFAECQCRNVLDTLPNAISPELPSGVVDFMKERAKRKRMESC